ncbi:hypothetical protein NPIL_6891 [Nephila pilipes]|uniref:Uncharacterized protein n=1 Tax=Nephila pilipes TaxID=299642 RepID=A0A8X6TX59_NEPPI|nr:hypothetical protein NPIL_6891 [Nephila pilipes]
MGGSERIVGGVLQPRPSRRFISVPVSRTEIACNPPSTGRPFLHSAPEFSRYPSFHPLHTPYHTPHHKSVTGHMVGLISPSVLFPHYRSWYSTAPGKSNGYERGIVGHVMQRPHATVKCPYKNAVVPSRVAERSSVHP